MNFHKVYMYIITFKIIRAEVQMLQVLQLCQWRTNLTSQRLKITYSNWRRSMKIKHDHMTRLVVTLYSSPFATLSFVFPIAPWRKHSIVIDNTLFEVKESLSLPLYAPNFSVTHPQTGFKTEQKQKKGNKISKGACSHVQHRARIVCNNKD